MTPPLDRAQRLAERCARDGEFRLFARYWNGTLRLDIGGEVLLLTMVDGIPHAAAGDHEVGPNAVCLSGPQEVWDKLLSPVPPPFFNDIVPAQAFGLRQEGEPETFWQYYPAVRRAVDLLRLDGNG